MASKSAITILLTAINASVAFASPFATSVVDYSPKEPGLWLKDPKYNDPSRALGRPYGVSVTVPDNTSVVSLGDGGSLTLSFDHNIIDDPANPGGYDFIVFSNTMYSGAAPTLRWQELAYVEISQNNRDWYLMLPNIVPSALTIYDTGTSSTVVRNYAEYTPTLALPSSRTAEEFYTVPDRQSVTGDANLLKIDPTSGGGDAFDIATAVKQTAPGIPMLDTQGKPVPAGITWFRYIRMTDAMRGDTSLGAEISSEIDAVADVAPAVPVGAARKLPAASNYAVIWSAKVTAVSTGEFWIEQPNKSAGLRIISSTTVKEGNLVAVTGHVTDKDGDKAITDALVTVLDSSTTSTLSPLGMTTRSATMQMTCGLLARVSGKRTTAGDVWFNISDGSEQEVKVICGASVVKPGSDVPTTVTGILTRDSSGTVVLKTRKPEDIKF